KKASRRGRDKEEPNAVGRPRTEHEDRHPNWRDIMHALYNGGASDAEVKVALAVPSAQAMSNEFWDDMQQRYLGFSEAVQEDRTLCRGLVGKAGQAGAVLA